MSLDAAGMQCIAVQALFVQRLGPRCMGETLHSTSVFCDRCCHRSIEAINVFHLADEALRFTESFSVALLRGISQHLNGLLPPQLEQETLVLQSTTSSYVAECASAPPDCTVEQRDRCLGASGPCKLTRVAQPPA